MRRQRTQKQNPVDPGIPVQTADHLQKLLLRYILRQRFDQAGNAQKLAAFPGAPLIRKIARLFSHPYDRQGRKDPPSCQVVYLLFQTFIQTSRRFLS